MIDRTPMQVIIVEEIPEMPYGHSDVPVENKLETPWLKRKTDKQIKKKFKIKDWAIRTHRQLW